MKSGGGSATAVKAAALLLLAVATSTTTAAAGAAAPGRPRASNSDANIRYIRQSDLPVTGREWVSLHQTIEFLPATNWSPPKQERDGLGSLSFDNNNNYYQSPPLRSLEEAAATDDGESSSSSTSTEENSQYRVQPFVDGGTDYNAYQQAWRMLGFMIDCDDGSTGDDNGDHHSNDKSTGEGCQRYIMWAAYVDLNYAGNGIGEYQYWDPSTNSWDKSACEYTSKTKGESVRCAKMDCHMTNTHWSLLGFFKHKDVDEWMGQLFKHEGVCVWTDDQYSFMKQARDSWPQSCSVSGTVTSDGDAIYYDLKPVHGGGIAVGLYTDTRCVREYVSTGKSDPITVENVVGNFLVNGGDHNDRDQDQNNNNNYADSTLSESMATWNEAFGVWNICHPCTAYDRLNYGYDANDDRGANYGKYSNNNDDYYYNRNNAKDFDCYDDAGYTNVNQCMKFMAKTTMLTATFRDLSLATAQGTLVYSPLANYRSTIQASAGTFETYLFLVASVCFLVYGILKFRRVRAHMTEKKSGGGGGGWGNRNSNPHKEPLVFA